MFFDHTQHRSQGWHEAKIEACKCRKRKLNEQLDEIAALSYRKANSKRRRKQRMKLQRLIAAQNRAQRKSRRMMDYAPPVKVQLSEAAQNLAQRSIAAPPAKPATVNPTMQRAQLPKDALLVIFLSLLFAALTVAYACKVTERVKSAREARPAPSTSGLRVQPPRGSTFG